MEIEYHEDKRLQTLRERGLDFARALEVFESDSFDVVDDRFDYGEERWTTYGQLDGRHVAMVWTERGNSTRIISMRHMHDWEVKIRRGSLD
jgi:uncharacterized DUF497 family protein